MINTNGNSHTFMECTSDYASSSIVIFGAPYDGTTTNRPGARFAPAAMRAESYGLETYSPYCDKDLQDCAIYDAGELEFSLGSPENMLGAIESAMADIAKDGKITSDELENLWPYLPPEEIEENMRAGQA